MSKAVGLAARELTTLVAAVLAEHGGDGWRHDNGRPFIKCKCGWESVGGFPAHRTHIAQAIVRHIGAA